MRGGRGAADAGGRETDVAIAGRGARAARADRRRASSSRRRSGRGASCATSSGRRSPAAASGSRPTPSPSRCSGATRASTPTAIPSVRLEAGRVRRALERYYLVAGQADPVLIEIPKGAYVPVFTARAAPAAEIAPEPDGPAKAPTVPAGAAVDGGRRAGPPGRDRLPAGRLRPGPAPAVDPRRPRGGLRRAPPRAVSAAGPVLVVTPFADLGEGPEAGLYAAGLGEEVLAELATSRELTVLGRETSRSVRPGTGRRGCASWARATRSRAACRRRAAGSAPPPASSRSRRARCSGRRPTSGRRPADLLAGEEDIARRMVTEVAQPFGAVSRAEAGRSARLPPDDPAAYACTLRFYDYQAELGPALHAEVRGCLERAVAALPGLRHRVGDAVGDLPRRGPVPVQSRGRRGAAAASGRSRPPSGRRRSTPGTRAPCRR